MKRVFVANWKMNHLSTETKKFVERYATVSKKLPNTETAVCPPYPLIPLLSGLAKEIPGLEIGAQNVHWADSGAFTGEVSATLLKELGATTVIVGHSERRQFFGETDEAVSRRAKNAIKHGLKAIVCIGETKEQFESKQTQSVVLGQLRGSTAGLTEAEAASLLIAYEPVWAIGTGLPATPEGAAEVHSFIRKELVVKFGKVGETMPILYGGSTKPENIAGYMAQPNINGALVGGASLDADSFWSLVEKGSS